MAEKLSVTDVDVDSALRLLDEPIATWSRTTSTAVCVTRLRRRWGQERYEQQAQFDLLTYETAFARGGGAEALRAAETISERLTGRTSRPELDEELALLLPQSFHVLLELIDFEAQRVLLFDSKSKFFHGFFPHFFGSISCSP